MKRLTVTNISVWPYLKWAFISYMVFGVFTGFVQAIYGYLATGGELASWLFWYGLGIPVLYLTVGPLTGAIFIFLYNSFNRSIGSYTFEAEETVINDDAPPPPPDEFRI
jgi:hypothetical protein